MFKFLFGVAFGAAGYWAWQSFGRDLLGMGGDQDTAYGSFSSTPSSTSFGSGASTYGASSTTPSTTGASASPSSTNASSSSGGSTTPTTSSSSTP